MVSTQDYQGDLKASLAGGVCNQQCFANRLYCIRLCHPNKIYLPYLTIYFTEMQNAARFPTFSLKPEWLPTVGGFQRTVATFPDWGTIIMT